MIVKHLYLYNGKVIHLCQIGSLPFTYLGLPLRITKPRLEDFEAMVSRVERRMISTSIFLTEEGKLEMVKSVISSMPTYYMTILKVPISILNQVDEYRRHDFWNGSDINSKKPPLVACKMVTRPKLEVGLGLIKLRTHNDTLLMKYLHKVNNKLNIPWVKHIWESYYSHRQLPSMRKVGSFCQRDITKLNNQYRMT
jgi:hypothetical protein